MPKYKVAATLTIHMVTVVEASSQYDAVMQFKEVKNTRQLDVGQADINIELTGVTEICDVQIVEVPARVSVAVAEATNKSLDLGEAWFQEHKEHVQKLTSNWPLTELEAVEPSGEDRFRPELWKAIHWQWFYQNRFKRIVAYIV